MRGELKTYQAKRRFEQTPEPKGAQRAGEKDARRFVIQRHAATRLHYDFRIEADGVLKSWAVTKAPSRDPAIKRLAVEVEDHPLDYGDFEGTIPAGNYGAGTVQLWDVGSWEPQEADLEAAWARGQIKMILHGERLKGKWALIRLKSDRGKPSKRNNWLLLKEKDEHAVAGEGDALAQIDASVTTGRSLVQIAEGDAQWTSSKPTRRKAPPKPAPSKATSKAKRPHAFVPIQLCKAVDHPPSATGWAHEIKFDGYRLQIGIGGGQAVLRTRKGLDWSDRFPELATDAAGWPDAVIDGELCALDDDHMPDFSALQAAISEGETDRLVYFAFDLLFEGAEDLRKLPLSHRKARLQAYIDRLGAKKAARLRYVEHFASTGQAVLESACRMHLEGVISKKLDAPYHAGRSSSWVKSKCRGRDEVVIGGWSSEGGSRFRSLLVGVREKGGMKYLGRVGTGFGETATRLLMPALKAEAADKSPFVGPGAPKGGKDIHWVKPRLVAEIEHGGYTESGALRHAAFKGLRDDKTAEDVTDAPQAPAAPQAPRKNGKVSVAGVAISSPDKVLWPGSDGRPPITKADLARYYEAAAERLLAHVADRPVSIIRAPDGIEGETFFQRHAMAGSNPRLKLIDVKARTPYVARSNHFRSGPRRGAGLRRRDRRRAGGQSQAGGAGAQPLRQDDGRKGAAPGRADPRRRPLARHLGSEQGLRQGRVRGDQGRRAGPFHHHPGQEGEGRKDLHRLSAQRPHGDRRGALVAARPARRGDRFSPVVGSGEAGAEPGRLQSVGLARTAATTRRLVGLPRQRRQPETRAAQDGRGMILRRSSCAAPTWRLIWRRASWPPACGRRWPSLSGCSSAPPSGR